MDEIVRVHPGDEVAPAMTQADLESGDDSAAFALDDPYARVSRHRVRENARRLVGRGVVDADDLETGSVALAEQALERRGKRGRRIASREEDAQHGSQDIFSTVR
jgi:hypothetical protein